MSSFNARLHMPGQTRLPLSVEVDVVDERLILTAGSRRVADWPIGEVSISPKRDGFHLVFEHEEVVLSPDDPERLARELKLAKSAESPATRLGASSKQSPVVNPSTLAELRIEEFRRRISDLEESLQSNGVTPQEAFARWLRLAKDLNRRHGSGSLPSHAFNDLNTSLLDLLPEPAVESVQ